MSSNPQITIGITATDQARHVLQGVDRKVVETTQVVDQQGAKMVSRSQQMAASFKTNLGSIVTAAAGLTAGVVGLVTSFSSIEKAQNTAAQANITYQASLQQLNKLQEGGRATSEQLALAQEKVRVNADKLKTAQGDVNDRYMTFLANVPSQLISFGVAGSGIMKLLGVSHHIAGFGASAQAAQTVVLTGALRGANIAAAQTSLGMRLLHIAMGPVGWVILGVGTAIALVATNTFGLRDAIFNLGKTIMTFLDKHFKPLADAMRWFFENVLKKLDPAFGTDLPDSVQTAEAALDSFKNETIETTGAVTTLTDATSKIANGLDEVKKQLAKTNVEVLASSGYWRAFATDVIDAQTTLDNMLGSLFQTKTEIKGLILPGGSFRGAFGPGVPTPSSTVNLTNNLTNFANPAGGRQLSARVAQGGLNEFLNQDTVIFAHKGEQAQITQAGQGRGRGELHLHFEFDKREFAKAIVGDIDEMITRKRTIHMRITHEAIHGTG